MHQHIPFLRMTSTMTPSRVKRSLLATIKAQSLYDVADPDFDPYDGDQYNQQLIQEKQSLEYSVLVTFFRQIREEN